MNPLLKTPKQLIATNILWLLLGAALATALAKNGIIGFSAALEFSVPAALLLGAICASAYYVSVSFPITQRTFIKAIILFTSSSIAAALLWLFLCHAITAVMTSIGSEEHLINLNRNWKIILATVGALSYAISLLVYDVLLALNTLQTIAQKEAAKDLWARDVQLKALRAQINPHFLFNSLNSISALTSMDSNKAREMIIQLSQFFRETLASADTPLISLQKELEICSHFLAIEKLRYGDKLRVEYSVDNQLLNTRIPPLCLQPLIENAIKHGISQRRDTSTIHIEIQEQQQRLYIIITNPLAESSLQTKPDGTNTGLSNLRARLNLLYGDNALCEWKKMPDEFRVELVIPIQHAPDLKSIQSNGHVTQTNTGAKLIDQ